MATMVQSAAIELAQHCNTAHSRASHAFTDTLTSTHTTTLCEAPAQYYNIWNRIFFWNITEWGGGRGGGGTGEPGENPRQPAS